MHEILSWENMHIRSVQYLETCGELGETQGNSGFKPVLNLINVKLVEQEKIVFKNV